MRARLRSLPTILALFAVLGAPQALADGTQAPPAVVGADPDCASAPASSAQMRPARPAGTAANGRLIVAGSQAGCARIEDPAAVPLGPIGVEIKRKRDEAKPSEADPSLTIEPQVD